MKGIIYVRYLSARIPQLHYKGFQCGDFSQGPGGRDRTPSSPENLDCLSGNKM